MSIKIKGKNLHILFKKENDIIKLRKYYNQLNLLNPNNLKTLEKTTTSKINSLSLEKKDIEFFLIDNNDKTNNENITNYKNILGNKTSISNKENLLKQRIYNNNNKIIHKSKSDSNIINKKLSKFNRFDNYNEYLIKFLPGPGQYNLNKENELFGKNKNHNNFLYNSLFKSYVKPEKINKINEKLGPGYYDPLILNKNNSNIILNTKEKRFVKSKSDLIGPGKYFDNILVKYNSFNWNEKNKSPQFILNDCKYNDISEKIKEEYVLSKYIKLGNEKNDEKNIKKNFSNNFLKINKEFLNYIVYPQKNIKKIIIKNNYNDDNLFTKKENDDIQNKINFYKLNILNKYKKDKDKYYYKGISSFISKSKRISIYDQNEKKHFPGPCYYQKIEKKNKKLNDYFKFDIKEYFKKKKLEYEKNKSKN